MMQGEMDRVRQALKRREMETKIESDSQTKGWKDFRLGPLSVAVHNEYEMVTSTSDLWRRDKYIHMHMFCFFLMRVFCQLTWFSLSCLFLKKCFKSESHYFFCYQSHKGMITICWLSYNQLDIDLCMPCVWECNMFKILALELVCLIALSIDYTASGWLVLIAFVG